MLKDPNAGKITDSEVEKAFMKDSVLDDQSIINDEALDKVIDANAQKEEFFVVQCDENEQVDMSKQFDQ